MKKRTKQKAPYFIIGGILILILIVGGIYLYLDRQSSFHDKLPLSQKEFIKFSRLIEILYPKVGKMHLTRNGTIQIFNNDSKPELWVRAPFAQGNFSIKGTIPTPFMLLPLSKIRTNKFKKVK